MIGARLGIENTRTVYLDYSRGAARWQQIIDKDKGEMRQLAEKTLHEMAKPTWIRYALYALYTRSRRPFLRESNALADAINSPVVDKKTMALLQLAYTFSHLSGCTAAVYHHPDFGMLHIRCVGGGVSIK